uniref:Cytochrome n=1 Tax=Globodera pallida TaxID=36090 RepID=A0A183BIY2_GLOPA
MQEKKHSHNEWNQFYATISMQLGVGHSTIFKWKKQIVTANNNTGPMDCAGDTQQNNAVVEQQSEKIPAEQSNNFLKQNCLVVQKDEVPQANIRLGKLELKPEVDEFFQKSAEFDEGDREQQIGKIMVVQTVLKVMLNSTALCFSSSKLLNKDSTNNEKCTKGKLDKELKELQIRVMDDGFNVTLTWNNDNSKTYTYSDGLPEWAVQYITVEHNNVTLSNHPNITCVPEKRCMRPNIFAALVTSWIFFQYRQKQHWHSIGVEREMFSKYGNSYGSFLFDRREFCTKDPEMMRQIFIKEFSHFQNRFNLLPERKEAPKSLMRNMLSVLCDEDWKRVRNRITPAFTTGKLKKLIPILCDSSERLCKVIEKDYAQEQKELPLKEFETTGATLTFATYMLAIETEVQEKLRSEVNDVLGEKELMTYEDLRQMHYLRAVVQETLRMFPVAPKINRECNSDCVINGVPFQKGDLVSVPVYFIQHDEAFFPEPDQFDPERFMPAQKTTHDPLAFLTFGLGPRNCIGMRFAEFQMHVALALVVRRFRFIPGPNTTKYPPKLLSSDMLRTEEPLVVIAEKI